MKNKEKTVSIIEGYADGEKAIQKAIKIVEQDKLERNVYILELVRNYYNQKVLSDTLTLGERKRAAYECAKMLKKSDELGISFLGRKIDRLLEGGFFYKGYLLDTYQYITYTTKKYIHWLQEIKKEKQNG